jgi:signal transduction histidine kinase
MEVRIHARTTSVWFLTLALLAVLAAMLDGCSSSRIETASAAGPAIEFTSVPLAGEDDPKQLYIIKGRVMGAQPGEQIVLYAKGQSTWWVQPFADHPFTKIQGDSVWNSQTHPGIEYAALLVGPDYHPQFTADVLPTEGVLASAVSKGRLPFWEKWWFPFLCMIAGAPIVLVAHRLRIRQMCKKMDLRLEERLAERTRVAQELHDTMLHTVLSASMQLHVAVDQLPADSPVLPAMNRVLQLMGQVAQEGRNTVRGLRSSIVSAHDLKTSLSRVPEELAR